MLKKKLLMTETTRSFHISALQQGFRKTFFLFAMFILHSRESDVSLCFGR